MSVMPYGFLIEGVEEKERVKYLRPSNCMSSVMGTIHEIEIRVRKVVLIPCRIMFFDELLISLEKIYI